MHDTLVNWICDFLAARKYRVKVNFSYSGWNDIASGISQGSVLGPFLFLIYINDLIDCCGAYSGVCVFVDDAKFYRHILTVDDNKTLHYALDTYLQLQDWSQKWLLNLNIKKCQVACPLGDVIILFVIAIIVSPQVTRKRIPRIRYWCMFR